MGDHRACSVVSRAGFNFDFSVVPGTVELVSDERALLNPFYVDRFEHLSLEDAFLADDITDAELDLLLAGIKPARWTLR